MNELIITALATESSMTSQGKPTMVVANFAQNEHTKIWKRRLLILATRIIDLTQVFSPPQKHIIMLDKMKQK